MADNKKPSPGKIDRMSAWSGWKLVLIVLAVLVVFTLGVNVGNGQISWPGHSGQNQQLPSQLNYSSVNQVYQLLKSQYNGKLTETQLLNGMKEGLAQATGDPYTEYFTPAQAKQFNNELQGTFSGIGAQLGADKNGTLEVIAPLAGTPAAKAGLKPQDLIIAINGKSTSSMSVDAAVSAIRGPSGSKVELTVVRGGQQQNFTITRANITVPSVSSQILPGNIGYMQINQFSNDTSSLANQAATKFKQAGVKGIILDLRGNPGGEVDAAVSVSSLWLDPGTIIMQEKTGGQVVHTYNATGNNTLNGIPTVVLIDGGTASAAEITAGALHDNHAAYIIGTKSYGKGVVQAVNDLPGGAELKITIASWYRPDGQNINHKGITPDQTVKITDAQVKAGQDPQKDAALQWLSKH